MVEITGITVTGKVSGKTPVRYACGVVDVDTIEVSYERDQTGAWVHHRYGITVNGMYLDSDYTGPVDELGPEFPVWVTEFVDAARPTIEQGDSS
jgi:hypothetical protein